MTNTKRTTIATAIGLVLGGLSVSFSAQAALTTGAMLVFDAGVRVCYTASKTYPNCGILGSVVSSGSYFSMDGDGNGTVTDAEKTIISLGPDGGIIIGVTQDTNGHLSHNGAPEGGFGGLDQEWSFLGSSGMDYTTLPITVVTDGGTTKTLDFSGWTWTWNGVPSISWGGDPANFAGDTGLATITCSSVSCSNTSTFTLTYNAHAKYGDPSGFGGVAYGIHMTGTVSAVPVPAAAWLFGSGLIGLVGAARRKRDK